MCAVLALPDSALVDVPERKLLDRAMAPVESLHSNPVKRPTCLRSRHGGDAYDDYTEYEVLDYFYTPRSIDFGSELGEKLLKLPRKAFFAIQRDLAARLLGGFGLLVFAR